MRPGTSRKRLKTEHYANATYIDILAGFEEVTEAVEICKRELQLYEHKRIVELSGKVYGQMLEYSIMCLKFFRESTASKMVKAAMFPSRHELSEKIQGIHGISERVLREVDF